MKRNKILFGLAALIVAFGLIISVSAFTTKSANNTTMYYQFNSDQEVDISDPAKWSPIDVNDVPTASCDGEALGCVISFNTGDFDDLEELLQTYPSTSDLRDNNHVIAEKNPITP